MQFHLDVWWNKSSSVLCIMPSLQIRMYHCVQFENFFPHQQGGNELSSPTLLRPINFSLCCKLAKAFLQALAGRHLVHSDWMMATKQDHSVSMAFADLTAVCDVSIFMWKKNVSLLYRQRDNSVAYFPSLSAKEESGIRTYAYTVEWHLFHLRLCETNLH